MNLSDFFKESVPTEISSQHLLCNTEQLQLLEELLKFPLNKITLKAIADDSSEHLNMQAWIIILAKHKELNTSKLSAIARQLKISNENQLTFAYVFGRLDFATIERYTYLSYEFSSFDILQSIFVSLMNILQPFFMLLGFRLSKPELYQYKLQENTEFIFRNAAACGHLHILEHFASQEPEQLLSIIASDHYACLGEAAEKCHAPVLRYILEHGGEELRAMIPQYNFQANGAFRKAGEKGHLGILKYIMARFPERFKEETYEITFGSAAGGGQLHILKYFESRVDAEKLQAIIKADDYYAFTRAAEGGHIPVLQYLEEKAPDKLQDMIKAEYYFAFARAAEGGHLAVLQYLEEKAPDKLQTIIDNCAPFARAAAGGHLAVLQYLEEKAPDKLQDMIEAADYYAFKIAATGGHIPVLQYLEEKAPDKLQAMIKAQVYYAFKMAAEGGHIPVLQYLEEKDPNIRYKITGVSPFAFRRAVQSNHSVLIAYLLESPAYFRVAVMEGEENTKPLVRRFMTDTIANLRGKPAPVEVSSNEALLLYQFVKSLIELNEPTLNADIGFLLDIPAVRVIAHDHGLGDEVNALFILALQRNHLDAILALSNIPEVNRIARENNFYADRVGNNRALRDLVDVHRDFTADENQMLNEVRTHYAPKIEELGKVDAVLQHLRNRLKAEYMANMATVLGHIKSAVPLPDTLINYGIVATVDGRQIMLPFDDSDLDVCIAITDDSLPGLSEKLNNELQQTLNLHPQLNLEQRAKLFAKSYATLLTGLFKPKAGSFSKTSLDSFFKKFSADTKEKILNSYYNNPYHAAYRYLLDPNPFMSDKAHWGAEDIDPEDLSKGKRSFFEKFKNDIAMFYLGAIDEAYPTKQEGNSIEARFTTYAKAIADLNQGHSHIKEGVVVGGDNPACKPGTPAYIVRSVQDHLLFSFVSKDTMLAEYKSFIQDYYRKKLAKLNIEQLKVIHEAMDEMVDSGNTEKDLTSYNITAEEISSFIEALKNNYQEKFSFELEIYTRKLFELKVLPAHVAVNLDSLRSIIIAQYNYMVSCKTSCQTYLQTLQPAKLTTLKAQWKQYVNGKQSLDSILEDVSIDTLELNNIKTFLTNNQDGFGVMIEQQFKSQKVKVRAVRLGQTNLSVFCNKSSNAPICEQTKSYGLGVNSI